MTFLTKVARPNGARYRMHIPGENIKGSGVGGGGTGEAVTHGEERSLLLGKYSTVLCVTSMVQVRTWVGRMADQGQKIKKKLY